MQGCYWHPQFRLQLYSSQGITVSLYPLHLQNNTTETELLREAQATVLTLSVSMETMSWLSSAQSRRPDGDVLKVGGVC